MVCVIVNLLQIKREQVNLFNSGKNIPKCELVLEWGKDTPPTLLHYPVGLLGAGDHNFFLLGVNPGKCIHPCIRPCTLASTIHPCIQLCIPPLYPHVLPSLVTCSTKVGFVNCNDIHSVQIYDSNHTHS